MTAHRDIPKPTTHVSAVNLHPQFGELRRDPQNWRAIGVREVSSAVPQASAEAWASLRVSA